jgi:predicted ATPase
VVLLSGEAGVGKTSLVRELAAAVAYDVRVLVGWCEPLVSPRPLAPLIDVLPGLGRRVGQAFARVREGAAAGELFDGVVH